MAALMTGGAGPNDLTLAVEATYLVKLPPFIAWPDDAFPTPASPFTVCVVGDDPFGDILDRALDGQRVGDHPVAVARLAAASPTTHCQIAFIGGGKAEPAETLRALRGTPVLTVTGSDAAGTAKGIVNFVLRENHIRLEIDDVAAAANHLEISSKLLAIAASVRSRT
jgi:hypothetical protein